jgi:hypothetical protein
VQLDVPEHWRARSVKRSWCGGILTPGGGPVYVSGLGDALVKLDE